MARIYYLLLFTLLPWAAYPANEWFPIGAKMTSMGYTSVTYVDLWSVHNNQAAMAFCNQAAIGAYFENRFMIRELGYQAAAIVLPTRYGSIGANVLFNGDQNMNQLMAGFCYARKFGEKFSAGIQVDYMQTFLAEGYGLHQALTFEGGILAKINKELSFGAHIFNPVSARLATYNDERIPTEMNAGFN